MTSRFALATVGMVLALVFSLSLTAVAADKTHEGKIVSVKDGKDGADGKLVMTDNDGKNEHSHNISSSVKITLNDKEAKLADLKKGDAVKVTTDENGKVKSVAATREKA